MAKSARRSFEVRGIHVLLAMLAFFAAVIAVNVAFAVAAVRTFPGEDVHRSYLQGLHYNDVLAKHREQAALGWRATAALASVEDALRVEIALVTRDGAPLDGLVLSGELERPTDSRLDVALHFTSAGAGRYIAPVNDLPPGRWRLRAQARGERDEALDFESELTWRPSH